MYLENLTKEQKADKEIVLVAVQANAYAIQYASDELKNDKEIVLATIQENGWALSFVSDELKNDKEVIIEAVKQSPELLKYASRDLRADKEIVYKFITPMVIDAIMDRLSYVCDHIGVNQKTFAEAMGEALKEVEIE